jgi:hypothetical protein
VASNSAGSVTRSPVAVITGAPTSSMFQPRWCARRAMPMVTKNSTMDDSKPPTSEMAIKSRSGTVGSPMSALTIQASKPAWVADAKLRIVAASIWLPR